MFRTSAETGPRMAGCNRIQGARWCAPLVLLLLLPVAAQAAFPDSLWTTLYEGPPSPPAPWPVTCRAADVVVDTLRNRIYVCGSGESLGLSPQTDYANMAVVAFDLAGKFKWAQSYGGNINQGASPEDLAQAIAVDSVGNVWVVGTTQNQSPRFEDISWCKFDSNGNSLLGYSPWPPYMPGWKSLRNGADYAFDIVIGTTGAVYVCGAHDTMYQGQQRTCLTVGRLHPDSCRALWWKDTVLDINADGKRPRRQRDRYPGILPFGLNGDPYAYSDFDNVAFAAAPTPDGGVVVTGLGEHDVTDYDWFTVKLNPDGVIQWARRRYALPSQYEDVALDVAVATDGNIYVCGWVTDLADVQMSVACYNSAGTLIGFSNGTNSGDDYAVALALDQSSPEKVYVTAYNEENDVIITQKYTHSLTPVWGLNGALYGDGAANYPHAISCRGDRVYVTGWYGTDDVTRLTDDVMVLCYDTLNPPGSLPKDTLWTWACDGPDAGDEDFAAAITVLDSERIYVAGQFGREGDVWSSMFLTRLRPTTREVSVARIVHPGDTILVGSPVTPQVWVKSAPTSNDTFVNCRVVLLIDGGVTYADTAVAAEVRPGESTLVSFDPWAAPTLGPHVVRCSVEVRRHDPIPANNVLMKTVIVAELDVACSRLVGPSGVYDSGTAVVPQAWVKNLGNLSQNFGVRMALGQFYADTQSVTLAPAGQPGDSLLVSFRPVTLQQRGSWAVTCSTMLAGDRTATNDFQQELIRVRVTDAQLLAVVSPPETVFLGSDAELAARFRNGGTDTAQFWTYYRVEQGGDKGSGKVSQSPIAISRQLLAGSVDSVVCNCSALVTLGPLAETVVVYDTLLGLAELGEWQLGVSCVLAGDQQPGNNAINRTMFVYEHDVACSLIVAPTGEYDSGTLVTPQAWLRNLSSQSETFNCSLAIGSYYGRVRSVTLAAAGQVGASQLVQFDTIRLRVRGPAAVRCRTMLAGDRNPSNDLVTGSIRVRVTDAAVTAIPQPPETVFGGDDVQFAAVVANQGTDAADIRAYFCAVYGGDTVAFLDSVDLVVQPLADSVVNFRTIAGINRLGVWQLAAWCRLAGDQRPENDTFRDMLFVGPPGGIAWPAGWWEDESLPRGSSNKLIKAGGALAVMDKGGRPVIYALKGNKTNEFYSFDILETDPRMWRPLTPVQPGPSGRLPGNGACLATDNQRYVYMVKGNNTSEFWRYDTQDSTWLRLESVPPGPKRTRVKGGGDMVYVSYRDSGFLYLLKGMKDEFYRFNVLRGTWEGLPAAPAGSLPKWNKGSFLVYDGVQTIYALKAKNGELWRFDVAQGRWDLGANLEPMPLMNSRNRRKKPGEGAAGAWYQDGFYAFKGGNTNELWRYYAATDSWRESDTIKPIGHTMRKKLVKAGGDLVEVGYALWAFKGNNTNEFWRYGIPLGMMALGPAERSGALAAGQVVGGSWRFNVAPSLLTTGRATLTYDAPVPAAISLRVYDALGRVVAVPVANLSVLGSGSVVLDLTNLPAGCYLGRISCPGAGPDRVVKLVVQAANSR